MRILQVIPSLDPALGGPAEAARQVSAALGERGHDVDIATFDRRDDGPAAWSESTSVVAFGTSGQVPAGGRPRYSFEPQATRWIREHADSYDACIVHGLWQYHGLAVWRALRGGPVPYYVFAHGMLDPWFRRAHPLKHLKKLAYWLPFQRRILRDAAGVLFTCEEERVLAAKSFPLYDVKERVLGYGIAPPALSPAEQKEAFLSRFPHLRDTRYLLYLSRIHPKKGLDVLLEAFASSHDARTAGLHLVIAGPPGGRWEEGLRSQAASLGVADSVTWTGALYDDEKWGALLQADAFVLPSHQENFGIAVVEALACGTPVLITTGVNIWREIAQAQAGLVFDDTVAGVRSGLERWAELRGSQRPLMAERASALFADRFRIDRVAQRLDELLREDSRS